MADPGDAAAAAEAAQQPHAQPPGKPLDDEAEYNRGQKLIDTDPDEAAEVLARVLEARVQAFGQFAEEVAGPALFYGRALLENVRASTDALGSNKFRRKVLLASRAAVQAQADAEDAAAGNGQGGSLAQGSGSGAGPSTGPAEAPADVDGGDDDDNDDDDDGDASAASGSEEEKGEGDEGDEGDGDGDSKEDDDMLQEGDLQLAWETLDLARIICEKAGPKLRLCLADVHLALGDLAGEKEDLAGARQEYSRCQALLETEEPLPLRRLAEVHFMSMMVCEADEAMEEALAHCKAARKHITARKQELMRVLDTPVDGETGEEADAEIEALEGELDDLSSALQDLQVYEEEQEAALREQRTLRMRIRAAYAEAMDAVGSALTGASGSGSGSAAAAPGADAAPMGGAAGGSGSGPSGALGPTAAAPAPAPVRNLGVAGRGKGRITLQPCQPPAANGGAAAAPSTAPPAKRPLASDGPDTAAVTADAPPSKRVCNEGAMEVATENSAPSSDAAA